MNIKWLIISIFAAYLTLKGAVYVENTYGKELVWGIIVGFHLRPFLESFFGWLGDKTLKRKNNEKRKQRR